MNSRKFDKSDRATGFFLAALFALVLIGWVASLVPWLLSENLRAFFAGIFLIYLGAMFLASYYYSDRIGFLRGFMWICEQFSMGRHRRLAFFYFALCTVLGIVVMTR